MKKGMKRIIAAFMMAALVLTSQPGYVMAAEATGGENAEGWTAEFDEGTGTLTISGTGACKILEKPSYSDSVKKLVVGEGITSIECPYNVNLTHPIFPNVAEVSLPDTLKEVGEYAFNSCEKLTEVVLPQSLERIGMLAFGNCTQLTEINIPSTVTEIGENVFQECKNLKKVSLQEGLKKIGRYAFYNCGELAEITIPGTVEEIGERAFFICSQLTKIEIPGKVREIALGVFNQCANLKTVILNEGLETIGEYAFSQCGKITEIEIPKTVKKIEASAFANCDKLEKVTLHEGLETIGDIKASSIGTFWNCPLKEIQIPSTVKEIGTSAFSSGYMQPIILPKNLERLGDSVLKGNLEYNSITNLELPATLTYIGDDNFPEDCLVLCTNDYQIGYCQERNLKYADAKEGLDFSALELALKEQQYEYTGGEIQPKVKDVIYSGEHGGCVLKEGRDYLVSYKDNINCGTATVVLTGVGPWKGEKELNFEIYRLVEKCDISLEYDKILYNGQKQNPKVEVKYGEELLAEGEDYTLEYKNDINEGTATVVVTGKGTCKGSVVKGYAIYKKSVDDFNISLEYTSVLYDGSPKTPEVTVKDAEGNLLVKDEDYTLQYMDNIEEGTATVTVMGKGTCKGSVRKEYTIYKKSIDNCDVSLEYTSVLYDGSPKKPAVTVKDSAGNLLIESTDYEIAYINDTGSGPAAVTVTGIGIYKGEKSVSYMIEKISLENAAMTLSETIYTYDGSEKKPTVTVVLNGKTLTLGVDYVVTYEANINEGTAYAVILGAGHYTGAARVSFTILPYSAGKDSVYSKDDTLISQNLLYHITDEEEGEVEITSTSSKALKSLVVPATVTCEGKTYKVTSIGKNAFYKNTKLTSIVIGNNVTSIEDYAFYGCKNVTSIKMGRSVEIIGASSFRKCTKLKSIVLPKTIDELGKNAFYGCKKLSTITIQANSVVDIADNAIKGISKKAVIKVPKKLLKGYKKELGKKTGFKKSMKIKKK